MKRLFLLSVILLHSCTVRAELPEKTISFYVQPFENAQYSVDGTSIKPLQTSMHEKTMGKITLKIPAGKKQILTIKNDGYIPVQWDPSLKNPDLIVLDKANSGAKFLSRLATGNQPKSVTFIDNDRVVLPLLADSGVQVLNVKTGEKQFLQIPDAIAKKQGFVESLVRLQAGELWVSQMMVPAVHVFNLKDLSYKQTIQISGKWSKVMLEDKANKKVYLTNWLSYDISVIDTSSAPYKEITRWPTGKMVPRGLALSGDSRLLYVAEFEGADPKNKLGRVRKLSTETGKTLSLFGPPGSKRHITILTEQNQIIVSDMRTAVVEVYDLSTEKKIHNIPVYSKPNTITLSPDKSRLYVSCRGPNNPESYLKKGFHFGRVYTIDTKTWTVLEFWEGGNQPTGLDISPDGKTLVSSDFLDQQIRIYEILPHK